MWPESGAASRREALLAARRPDKVMQQACQAVLSTAAGRQMLDGLVIFAQQCQDPMIRVGRADVVLFLEREKKRADEPDEEEP